MIRNTLTPSTPSPATLLNPNNTSSTDISLAPQQLSWEFLRKQARQLENEIEQKLTSYSKLAAQVGRSVNSIGSGSLGNGLYGENGLSGNSSDAMELELDELIKKLNLVVSSMAEVVDRPSSTTSNPSMMHMLQRHRDILYDYSKEFKKTKANIQAAKNHSDLLSSVRDEIRYYSLTIYPWASSETDYFLSERSRIENSHRMTDMVLEQAYEAREEMGRQRSTLLNINSRMKRVTNISIQEVEIRLHEPLILKPSSRKKRVGLQVLNALARLEVLLSKEEALASSEIGVQNLTQQQYNKTEIDATIKALEVSLLQFDEDGIFKKDIQVGCFKFDIVFMILVRVKLTRSIAVHGHGHSFDQQTYMTELGLASLFPKSAKYLVANKISSRKLDITGK
ncbi:16906_t:CDS:2 [Acaulospora colombiana]|uniref:16906_t:CDS:1 n=1 Tax=Acaulospora colombiana TaxID=27376 RepID=A0ACA9K9S9_9GLOM|nr:16906_t:CDS:2 [Acaulospora colombiana]